MQVAKPLIKKRYIAGKSQGYSLQKLLQEISLSPTVGGKEKQQASRSVEADKTS
jgi:hypothetical protein